jgi:hypothetical protein
VSTVPLALSQLTETGPPKRDGVPERGCDGSPGSRMPIPRKPWLPNPGQSLRSLPCSIATDPVPDRTGHDRCALERMPPGCEAARMAAVLKDPPEEPRS